MRYLLILILCLCANCMPCLGQQSSTSPLYLGPILIDKSDVKAMADICEQYKLTEVASDDNFRAYKHDDGTLKKFNIISDSTGYKKPYVEIHTTESKKNIEKAILEAGFHKEKARYEKGYHGARKFSICQIMGNNYKRVIFTKENGNNSSY